MIRHTPPDEYKHDPCSIVGIGCATEKHLHFSTSHADGYMTLRDMNKIVRENCTVKKRIDYKRGQRPKLRDLHLDGRALVCVYGHFLYVDREEYWSFFDNEDDEVVAVWLLKD